MDQETLAYVHLPEGQPVVDLWTEANLQNWYTDTQWLPRLDYYRLGDSLLNNWFNYYQHSGVDYANDPHRRHGQQPEPLRVHAL